MADYRGTVSGSRGNEASRLGNKLSGLTIGCTGQDIGCKCVMRWNAELKRDEINIYVTDGLQDKVCVYAGTIANDDKEKVVLTTG